MEDLKHFALPDMTISIFFTSMDCNALTGFCSLTFLNQLRTTIVQPCEFAVCQILDMDIKKVLSYIISSILFKK